MSAHERRSWNRYSCDLKTFCRSSAGARNGEQAARICDISCGGIKVVSIHRFPLGTALYLQVEGADEFAPRALTAEVVRADTQPDGRWAMGCRLAKLMSERELARLLSLYQGESDAPPPPSPAAVPAFHSVTTR